VDGLWIDMNEAANFGNGPAGNPSNPVNNPPYAINNMGHKKPLNTKTLPMDAKHGWGIKTYLEYDVHNLYGMGEAIVTRQALEQHKGTRSFVLSRSTFVGTGAHAAHWLGDNEATWDDMRLSISGVLSMNLFGIPMGELPHTPYEQGKTVPGRVGSGWWSRFA
jgi:alpha-glucosidase (family GH31 glycosyl hydrolase)